MKLLILSFGVIIQTFCQQCHAVTDPNHATNVGVDMDSNIEFVEMENEFLADARYQNSNRVACGSTKQMYPGNTVQVNSTNFGIGNYQNNEACTWMFEANRCTLSADCPCVDLPKSWECLGDYLKIKTDYALRQQQRFCGGNAPGQAIYSDSDFLSVRFRSDRTVTASGFTCFIRCEGSGPDEKIPLATYNCPVFIDTK